jgi:hypothetical protein
MRSSTRRLGPFCRHSLPFVTASLSLSFLPLFLPVPVPAVDEGGGDGDGGGRCHGSGGGGGASGGDEARWWCDMLVTVALVGVAGCQCVMW